MTDKLIVRPGVANSNLVFDNKLDEDGELEIIADTIQHINREDAIAIIRHLAEVFNL